MSGRHRKPAQAGATVAKVAVTGAIMGTAGIAFSGTAQAAPDSDWDRLANCESSGNWGINTGNGYHGGLQFSPSTWNAYGGGDYAPVAYKATREQQISVAERVLEGQGWNAWPSCSSKLGLTSAPSQRDAPTVDAVQDTVDDAVVAVDETVPPVIAPGIAPLVPGAPPSPVAEGAADIVVALTGNEQLRDQIVDGQGQGIAFHPLVIGGPPPPLPPLPELPPLPFF